MDNPDYFPSAAEIETWCPDWHVVRDSRDDWSSDSLWTPKQREEWAAHVRTLEAREQRERGARELRGVKAAQKLAREMGQRITEIIDRPDGSRTFTLGEKIDTPSVEIDTPEQLRRLI
jgi:hypothetical protein